MTGGARCYPVSVITVAIRVVWVIMVWVIPAFKQVFSSFGANLPAPTLIVIAISDFFVSYWWLMAAIIAGALITFFFLLRRSEAFRYAVDRISLKLPIIGGIVGKATDDPPARPPPPMFARRRSR